MSSSSNRMPNLLLLVFFASWFTTQPSAFFFSSRRRHTRWNCDWSSDVCSSDLGDDAAEAGLVQEMAVPGDQGDRGVVGGYPGGGVFQQAGELGGGHGQGAHCRASCSSCPLPPPCRVPSPPAMLDSRSRSPAAACPAAATRPR